MDHKPNSQLSGLSAHCLLPIPQWSAGWWYSMLCGKARGRPWAVAFQGYRYPQGYHLWGRSPVQSTGEPVQHLLLPWAQPWMSRSFVWWSRWGWGSGGHQQQQQQLQPGLTCLRVRVKYSGQHCFRGTE